MRIRNLRIRSKLLLIYIFCVLLPIIITDIMVLVTVNQSSKEKQWKEYQYVMERVEYNLTETIKGCILFTSNLYNDRILDKFLNTDYENNLEYYEAYLDLLNNERLKYSYNNGVLYKIQVYTDNDSILSGGHIAKIDRIRDSEWYIKFSEQSQNVYVHTHYDEKRKRVAGGGTSRTISIIRKMNNFTSKDIEKILKIDIDYNFMLKHVMNEKLDASLYVTNDEHILFSNLPHENSMNEFQTIDAIKEKSVTMSKEFKVGNEQWKIEIVGKEPPIWSVLMENEKIWILILLNLLFPSLLIYIVGRSISGRLRLVSTAMDNVKSETYNVITTVEGEDEIGDLIRSYNLMVMTIKNLIEVVFKEKDEKQFLEISKKHAQLKALQSQVNPHFLFNTLETIRMRSFIKGEEETANIIGELAILFRKSMDWRQDYSRIDEEVSFVEKYINIQRYRFGDKIKFHSRIEEECLLFYVPKLGIATFIENACIHGIEASINDGEILLDINNTQEELIINIRDNGKGFNQSELSKIHHMIEIASYELLHEQKSTGMLNAYIRFKMFSEGNLTFHLESEQEVGTNIEIKIPLPYVTMKRES